MSKVTIEVAQDEVNQWLDYKQVGSKKREQYSEYVDAIATAISEGTMSIDDEKRINHTLKFPILDSANNPVVDCVTYKPRVSLFEIKSKTQSVKAGNADERIVAVASALTGVASGMLAKMDTEDVGLLQAVTVFFL